MTSIDQSRLSADALNHIEPERRACNVQRARLRGTGDTVAAPTAFGKTMNDALQAVNAQQAKATNLSAAYERGDTHDIVSVMVERQKASLGFEATVQVRNKLLVCLSRHHEHAGITHGRAANPRPQTLTGNAMAPAIPGNALCRDLHGFVRQPAVVRALPALALGGAIGIAALAYFAFQTPDASAAVFRASPMATRRRSQRRCKLRGSALRSIRAAARFRWMPTSCMRRGCCLPGKACPKRCHRATPDRIPADGVKPRGRGRNVARRARSRSCAHDRGDRRSQNRARASGDG